MSIGKLKEFHNLSQKKNKIKKLTNAICTKPPNFCSQVDFDPSQDNRQRHSQAAYEEDEEGYHQGPRIQQCSTN